MRTFSKNINSMSATKSPASRSASATLLMECSIKSACLNKKEGFSIPFGKLLPSSVMAFSTSFVSLMLSAKGCFCTDKITAGLPLKLPSPRFTAGASFTSASCLSRIAWPSLTPTTTLLRSSSAAFRPINRIKYSRPFASRKPPLVLLP